MLRVISYLPASDALDPAVSTVVLAHDMRHLRRKLLHLADGEMVMLDLKEAVLLPMATVWCLITATRSR